MSKATNCPDFFLVGAAKAGTTAVYTWLRQHPGAFLPEVKEPGYFAYAGQSSAPAKGPFDPQYVGTICTRHEDYARLYHGSGDRLRGDLSPVYLLDEGAAARIAAARPDARIIILLRDPVARAFSQFKHHRRDGLEPCQSFEAALQAEPERLQAGWSWGHGYATHGHYEAQVARYLYHFPRDQILTLEHQSLLSDPDQAWREICGHVGLSAIPLEKNEQVNATSSLDGVTARPAITRRLRHPGPLQKALKTLMPPAVRRALRRRIEGRPGDVPVLRSETRDALSRQYAGERLRLEEMTGLSLTHWSTGTDG
ncbi:sulfotransferase [Antarctobacter jejuensis]|uniref:sulfotransferase n=1 Tax=Antarctobacter jejuensis TaxID=1439938 RepID=UPI003FD4F617